MNTETEHVYNVYLVQGDQRDHVARVESQWDAEQYVSQMALVNGVAPDVIFEIEVETITTTRQLLARYCVRE